MLLAAKVISAQPSLKKGHMNFRKAGLHLQENALSGFHLCRTAYPNRRSGATLAAC